MYSLLHCAMRVLVKCKGRRNVTKCCRDHSQGSRRDSRSYGAEIHGLLNGVEPNDQLEILANRFRGCHLVLDGAFSKADAPGRGLPDSEPPLPTLRLIGTARSYELAVSIRRLCDRLFSVEVNGPLGSQPLTNVWIGLRAWVSIVAAAAAGRLGAWK